MHRVYVAQNLTQIAWSSLSVKLQEFTFLAIYISIFYSPFHGDWSNMLKGIRGFCQNIAQY